MNTLITKKDTFSAFKNKKRVMFIRQTYYYWTLLFYHIPNSFSVFFKS